MPSHWCARKDYYLVRAPLFPTPERLHCAVGNAFPLVSPKKDDFQWISDSMVSLILLLIVLCMFSIVQRSILIRKSFNVFDLQVLAESLLVPCFPLINIMAQTKNSVMNQSSVFPGPVRSDDMIVTSFFID